EDVADVAGKGHAGADRLTGLLAEQAQVERLLPQRLAGPAGLDAPVVDPPPEGRACGAGTAGPASPCGPQLPGTRRRGSPRQRRTGRRARAPSNPAGVRPCAFPPVRTAQLASGWSAIVRAGRAGCVGIPTAF